MKILSYNIQAAIHSTGYLQYAYQWPRQLLPTRGKNQTLTHIAKLITQYDVVCLQEIDLGGLRNAFHNQHETLQTLSGLPHHLVQINRRIGKLSLHGNLILSRYPIHETINTPLPSRIKGRGILAGEISLPDKRKIIIANTHLSLGKLDQHRQLRFIRTHLSAHQNVLICGDFNTTPSDLPLHILTEHGYYNLNETTPTFPSWRATKILDHALLKSKDFTATARVLPVQHSDHLPLDIELH